MLHLYLMTYIQEEKKWKEYGGDTLDDVLFTYV